MKAGVIAVAAALAGGAAAVQPGKQHVRRHAHEAFHERAMYMTAVTGTGSAPEPTCGCTTIYSTITGEGSLIFPPAPTYAANTTSIVAPPTSTYVPVPTTYPAPVVPTPLATTCPTPGVYTIPATTVTLTQTTTVCGATSTDVPAGTHTAGGVTTVVEKATTVVCPYAAVETNSDVTTSVIKTTTYVCPSAGTYTIAPLTTTVTSATVWVYPTPVSYAPGTYIQPEVVTTITKTNVVVFCPFTSPAPVKPTSTYVAPAPVVTYPAAKPTTAVSPPKNSPSKPSNGQLGSSGSQWAITYSPYQDNGQCKDAASVASDIARIAKAGFSTVRIYSSDCSGLQNIGTACEAHGLRIILGIFISSTGISGAAEQVTDIIKWNKWSMVDLVVVGNEAVFSGSCSGVELAAFIVSCKTAFTAAGYSGPITTTETLDVWQKNAAVLCPVVDVVGCNIHPFFNAEVDAEHAGEFVASQLKLVDDLCPGKQGLNLETGWPSAGNGCNGKACPGKDEQYKAIKGIEAAVGGKCVMFSMYNDLWKEAGAFGCEQSWGCIQIFE
ncbi:putative beta-glucosidase btgE [Rhexocercosporidium sp. MPI-PUGE-AT-0058]|nr:putative beta-glucosidase btgE [Rhexocercosporidium sp. MPI-PUGE-AT-0058]